MQVNSNSMSRQVKWQAHPLPANGTFIVQCASPEMSNKRDLWWFWHLTVMTRWFNILAQESVGWMLQARWQRAW